MPFCLPRLPGVICVGSTRGMRPISAGFVPVSATAGSGADTTRRFTPSSPEAAGAVREKYLVIGSVNPGNTHRAAGPLPRLRRGLCTVLNTWRVTAIDLTIVDGALGRWIMTEAIPIELIRAVRSAKRDQCDLGSGPN